MIMPTPGLSRWGNDHQARLQPRVIATTGLAPVEAPTMRLISLRALVHS